MALQTKLIISGVSLVPLVLLWAAEPPKTVGQKAFLFFASGGQSVFLFRSMLTVGTIVLNLGLWMV
jgi:hypothetical protein